VCELISLTVSLIHRYILQDSWNYPSLTKIECVLYSLLVLCRLHTETKVFLKFIEPSLWPPTARTWSQLITLYYEGLCSIAITLRFPTWMISKTVRTCWENLDQEIIGKSIDHWQTKGWMVRLNVGHIEQLFWLSGSFAAVLRVACAVTACMHFAIVYRPIERYDGTVTQSKSSK